DFHDHAVPMRPGDRVPGVARWTGSIGAETRVRGVDLRTHWRLLGPFVPISEPGVQTRTASVLDLGVAAPIGRVVVDVAIQNLLDLRYVENRASGFITPGVPRVLRLTLSTPGF
nr:TonB-dependent receptor [Gemmatimonadaceae bacterium]